MSITIGNPQQIIRLGNNNHKRIVQNVDIMW